MTREEAVGQFEAEGYRSFTRDWSMGETILVGIPDGMWDGLGVERLLKAIYIIPMKNQWGIYAPDLLAEIHYSRCYPFEEACDVARKFLKCEFLPFSSESVLIHFIRSEGGGSQVMEHVPTGKKIPLTRPGGEVLLKRLEALDALAYELALGERGR